MNPAPKARVLLVDDEPSILDALRRAHRNSFDISTAVGGSAALKCVEQEAPFDVVVADFKMPGMTGAELLSQIAELSPDATRLILTGNGEIEAAIDAVNTAGVFRLLRKPCERDEFARAIDAAFDFSRLKQHEKSLLEETVNGCIEVLSDVLSLTNPAAFGQANRVRQYVRQVCRYIETPDAWQYEAAALLSQLGCVALPADLIADAMAGDALTEQQQAAYSSHPTVGARLLGRIPRLEGVSEIIRHQKTSAADLQKQRGLSHSVLLGTQILSAATELDDRLRSGEKQSTALEAMKRRAGQYLPQVLKAMSRVSPPDVNATARTVTLGELQAGMTLARDIFSADGSLIMAARNTVSGTLIERLISHHQLRGIELPIHVLDG